MAAILTEAHNSPRENSSSEVLNSYRVADNLFLLGSFEKGLTIYNQQVRALNLAWAMVEASATESLNRVAVIGGGIAGLTAAAGLLKKGVKHVSVFEKHAALCPLQQGSDARWVHPRIYEWPNDGSTLPTAALPLLNWNAGRASDVVVEILKEWKSLKQSLSVQQEVDTHINVRHLRVSRKMEIEWVGQKLAGGPETPSVGTKEPFDSIILAVGFGVERDAKIGYWRNESLGQPALEPGRKCYLVSGHGDGALVDLFRIRIARFRQDRILVDLFSRNERLMTQLKKMKNELDAGHIPPEELYDRFENIAQVESEDFKRLRDDLQSRLRTDTEVVLRLHEVESFKKAFASKTSFQNKFLLYALYKAGGFYPSSEAEDTLLQEYGIARDRVIRRHGVDPKIVIQSVLDRDFFVEISMRLEALAENAVQSSEIFWKGGYWNTEERKLTGKLADNSTKRIWRQEYLPPATEVLATGFVAGVAGLLGSTGTCGDDFRVTLHRTLRIGTEFTLQQLTPYMGNSTREGKKGRTFGFNHATIGYAAVTMSIVRSRKKAIEEGVDNYRHMLQQDMEKLDLNEHSQRMGDKVMSVVAIPILETAKKYTIAVLFADSTAEYAFNDEVVKKLTKMSQFFASHIQTLDSERVRSFLSAPHAVPTDRCYEGDLEVIQSLKDLSPPVAEANVNYLNLEFTDFIVR